MKKLISICLIIVTLFVTLPMTINANEIPNENKHFVPFIGYPDLTSDDRMYEAVLTLNALNILNGYEDGLFRPDHKITRAQMCAIICRALNLEEEATEVEGSTSFSDVSSDHWASGYINLAFVRGIINGVGENKFEPDQAVTYNQAIKMIVSALGYEPMAKQEVASVNIVYPAGYLMIAEKLGISTDFLDGYTAAQEGNASRGVIALLIYNALEVPLLEEIDDYDKENESHKTLLANLGVLKLDGNIIGTFMYGSSCGIDEAVCEISQENNATDWNDYIKKEASNKYTFKLNEKFSHNINYYFGVNSTIYVQENDGKSYEIIGIIPNVDNTNYKFDIKNIDVATTNNTIYFRESSMSTKTTEIKLDKAAKVYYNYKCDNKGITNYIFEDKVIVDNRDIDIVVLDKNNDGVYDIVDIKEYSFDFITKVNDSSFSTKSGKTYNLNLKSNKVMNRFVDSYGDDVEFDDFEKGDVISVISDGGKHANYKWIEILNLKGGFTVEGMVYYINNDGTVGIGDNDYEVLDINLKPGDEGVFYLTQSGKVFHYAPQLANYAYIIDAQLVAGEDSNVWQIKYITKYSEICTAQVKDTFYIDDVKYNNFEKKVPILSEIAGKNINACIDKRIVSYRLNANGEISKINTLKLSAINNKKYESDSRKLGVELENDTIVFDLDVTKAEHIVVSNIDYLKDNGNYSGYVVSNIANENECVIITQNSEHKLKGNIISGKCENGITYALNLDNGIFTITGNGKLSGNINSIMQRYSSDIKKIIVCEGITEFDAYIFSGCDKMTNIEIPNSVISIGNYAFNNCRSLTEIMIPDSVTSIGEKPFSGCESLNNIKLPVSFGFEDYIFSGCSGLTTIEIPDGVTTIAKEAFYGCSGLKHIIIPKSVTQIGEKAFYGCNGLTTIEIPDGITTIAKEAFYGCSNLKNIIIPESVQQIGEKAFYGCSALTDIIIPNSVKSIENGAFEGCSSLTNVELPTDLTSINDNVFKDCICLNDINIPDTVTIIGEEAFSGCSGLTAVEIPVDVTDILYGAFEKCIGLTNISIPNSVRNIGAYTFDSCSNLSHIEIPNGITTISDNTFSGCVALTNIEIPDGVTSIGEDAFRECSNLVNIVIPDSVIAIGDYAFRECSNLVDIVIPDSVIVIGDYAFWSCEKLKNIVIPSSVQQIGERAFAFCSDLKHVSLLGKIKGMGEDAFIYCENLTDLTISPNVEVINIDAFPDSLTDIYYTGQNMASVNKLKEWFEKTNVHYCIEYDSLDEISVIVEGEEIKFEQPLANKDGYIMVPLRAVFEKLGAIVEWEQDTQTITAVKDDIVIKMRVGKDTFYKNDKEIKLSVAPEIIRTKTFIPIRAIAESLNYVVRWDGEKNSVIISKSESGKCGENMTYSFDATTGNLIISGTGDMQGWNSETYMNCPWHEYRQDIKSIEIMNGVTSISYAAFWNCLNLENIVIPDSVTFVDSYAFNNCDNLSEIKIPDGVKYINPYMFNGCDKLKNVIMPDKLEGIGEAAFAYCINLNNIELPDGIRSVGKWAFYGCTALDEILLPESITKIGDYVFQECSNLKSITIPSSVTQLGQYNFYNCANLTDVYYFGDSESVKEVLGQEKSINIHFNK